MGVSRPARLTALALASGLLATPAAAGAATWEVDLERSTFAVLTQRAGLAARLAHDHLIVARAPRCTVEFEPADPGGARLDCRQATLALDADPTAERERLAPRLELLGARTGALPPVDADDRAKIRAEMLGAGQLFAERFPEIRVELVSLVPRGAAGAGARVALGWDARLRLTLRGEIFETTAPVRFEVDGDALVAELLAELRFTDFRIEPYSGVLGTVRVADLFHLYVELVATREAP